MLRITPLGGPHFKLRNQIALSHNQEVILPRRVQQSLTNRDVECSGVPRGGSGVFKSPPPEILKALQNRAKLNPIVKTVKNC